MNMWIWWSKNCKENGYQVLAFYRLFHISNINYEHCLVLSCDYQLKVLVEGGCNEKIAKIKMFHDYSELKPILNFSLFGNFFNRNKKRVSIKKIVWILTNDIQNCI